MNSHNILKNRQNDALKSFYSVVLAVVSMFVLFTGVKNAYADTSGITGDQINVSGKFTLYGSNCDSQGGVACGYGWKYLPPSDITIASINLKMFFFTYTNERTDHVYLKIKTGGYGGTVVATVIKDMVDIYECIDDNCTPPTETFTFISPVGLTGGQEYYLTIEREVNTATRVYFSRSGTYDSTGKYWNGYSGQWYSAVGEQQPYITFTSPDYSISITEPATGGLDNGTFDLAGSCNKGSLPENAGYDDIYYNIDNVIYGGTELFTINGCIDNTFRQAFTLYTGIYTANVSLCDATSADCLTTTHLDLTIASGGGLVPLDQELQQACEDMGTIAGAFCKVGRFLFSPKDTSVERFTEVWENANIADRVPFGYLSLVSDSFIIQTTTPAFAFEVPDTMLDNILTPFRTAFTMLMWLMFGVYMYKRLKHFEL